MVGFVRGGALFLAVIATGVVAGILQFYSHTVMPGLGRTDDRTFVASFQALDRAIINPGFMSAFLGGALCAGLATVVSLGREFRPLLPWLLAGLLLYLLVLVITFAVHVPLNDAMKAAGHVDGAVATAVRERFHEARWAWWNLVRALAGTAAFGCLAWSLVQYGRLTR